MRYKISSIALALLLGAAPYAAAQEHPFASYQKALLARALAPADKAICDQKAGKETAPGYNACRVTRLFLADIKADRDKGFPPLTDIAYANDAETDLIMDRMTKYGG